MTSVNLELLLCVVDILGLKIMFLCSPILTEIYRSFYTLQTAS